MLLFVQITKGVSDEKYMEMDSRDPYRIGNCGGGGYCAVCDAQLHDGTHSRQHYKHALARTGLERQRKRLEYVAPEWKSARAGRFF